MRSSEMSHQYASLAAGRWQTLSLAEQLTNVGSDVARALRSNYVQRRSGPGQQLIGRQMGGQRLADATE